MPFALGQRLLAHRLFGHGAVALVVVAALILLMRFWPVLLNWWRDRR